MALHLSSETGPVRLDPTKWLQAVRDYAAARKAQKRANAEARAAETTAKGLRAQLFGAIGDAPLAFCGDLVLTRKATAAAAASLTLKDGTKLSWTEVSGITIGNRYLAAEDVATIYGGRGASVDLDVAGD